MAETSGRAVVEAFVRAIEAKDYDKYDTLLADDYVEEMPQSGERIRGRVNARAIVDNYPGGVGTIDATSSHLQGADEQWVMGPTFNIVRIEGSGDVFTYTGTIHYPETDKTWHIVAIAEVRGGRIAKTTMFYAEPFEAPAWRAAYVERM